MMEVALTEKQHTHVEINDQHFTSWFPQKWLQERRPNNSQAASEEQE